MANYELVRTDRDKVVCACTMGHLDAVEENAKYERAYLPYRWRERTRDWGEIHISAQ